MWWVTATLLWASHGDQQLAKTTWSTADGLPQSSVTAIDQDAAGTLLLGTYGGLVRFDGRTFRLADAEGAWSGLRVTAVESLDEEGTVLVGTQDGRVLWTDGRVFEPMAMPPGFAGMAVWSIAAHGDQRLAVSEGGVAAFDGNAWTTVNVPEGQYYAMWDETGGWIAGDAGLFRYRDGVASPAFVDTGMLRAMCRSRSGVFLGGTHGVFRLEGDRLVQLETRRANELLCSRTGDVWAGDERSVRIVGTPTQFDVEHDIVALYEDREDNVWVGTDGGGLTRVTREEWTVSAIPGGVLSMVEEDEGTLLVAGYCGVGGLFRVSEDAPPKRVREGCVRAMARDEEGVLLGLDESVHRWADGESQPIVEIGHWVLALAVRDDGLWIGTDGGGAYRWHDETLSRVDVGDDRVLSIAPGHDGSLWFGTHGGVTRLDADGVTRSTPNDGVPAGPVRGLLVEDDGTVLMATYGGGLGVLRDGRSWRLTAADGLAGNTLSSIIDDGRGSLWINGNRGLNSVRRDELRLWLDGGLALPRIRRWNSPEGNGGGQPAGTMLANGTLAVPTIAGVVFLSPAKVRRNSVRPDVVLMSGDVDGVPLDPERRIVVPPGPGRVHVEFTAATLRHPELATLEYRLPNDDGAWRLVRDGSFVWAGVDPGQHVVELRATNEDGVPSEVLALEFEVEPHLLQRWTFWLAVAGMVLAAGAAAHRWRTRAIAEKNRELQREVRQRIDAEEERERISRRLSVAERMEAVGRLAGGIAHDFNNLLTAVSGASSVLREVTTGAGQGEAASRSLESLERCVERGAGLTRRLLAFARQQPMERVRIDPGAQLQALLPLLSSTVRDDIEIDLVLAVGEMGIDVDPSVFELAIVNLVLNAADAMPEGGRIQLSLERMEPGSQPPFAADSALDWSMDWVVVSIQDDGVGMTPETLAKAREPFFTTRKHGNGLGLPSVDGFVEQSGGEMHISSAVAVGTTVALVLPAADAPAEPGGSCSGASVDADGRGRVLLCDDDDLVRESLHRVLERAGYQTVAFGDPQALLDEVEPGQFDILVTDVLMPGLSGGVLAQRMRARDPNLRVVFISGYTDDVAPDELCGRLLYKPFRSQDVVALVGDVLNAAE
ncbi:MAG: ATP-binding protein [Myxococcota bacterium]